MSDEATRRAQRLAAKLRENLKRRKEQARARAATTGKPQLESESPDDPAGADALKPRDDSGS